MRARVTHSHALTHMHGCIVQVPCFLYHGKFEACPESYGKLHQRLIGDNAELIVLDGAGHLSIALGYPAILRALVKKESAPDPLAGK